VVQPRSGVVRGYGEAKKSYKFGYVVKDGYHGGQFSHHEVADGGRGQVRGAYSVKQPDGQFQKNL
jgi:hypothetical protein